MHIVFDRVGGTGHRWAASGMCNEAGDDDGRCYSSPAWILGLSKARKKSGSAYEM